MPQKISQERLFQLAHLSDDAWVRMREASAIAGVSESTGWRRVKAGIWRVHRVCGTSRIRLGDARGKCATTPLEDDESENWQSIGELVEKLKKNAGGDA